MVIKTSQSPEAQLVVWGLFLNGIWEFAHSSLYIDHSKGLGYIIWSRLHCTIGDVMILLFCFWATGALFRSRQWPSKPKYMFPATVFVTLGIGYTFFSEWMNTQVRERWEYSTRMPTLLNVGLSPILQWIVIPPILILKIRKSSKQKDDHSG